MVGQSPGKLPRFRCVDMNPKMGLLPGLLSYEGGLASGAMLIWVSLGDRSTHTPAGILDLDRDGNVVGYYMRDCGFRNAPLHQAM